MRVEKRSVTGDVVAPSRYRLKGTRCYATRLFVNYAPTVIVAWLFSSLSAEYGVTAFGR